MSSNQTVIRVRNLSKQYMLGQIGTGTLRHDINRWWHRLRGYEDPYLKVGEENDRTRAGNSQYVWALRDINFDVAKGEVLGIIGRNGAGKSTLLKILSRTTAPTRGVARVRGRIASLLEVGTGFHPDLSGRDNIYLNGAILGMTRQEISAKFDQIVDFSGVERYIDTPVKRYSSGMYVRLAFAVAAHLEPEILIVDEVLAVGDAEFQKKCLGRMKDVSINEGRTVLFVTHDLNAIVQLCDKAMHIAQGSVAQIGPTNEVVEAYIGQNNDATTYTKSNPTNAAKNASINLIALADQQGMPSNTFSIDEDINIRFQLTINKLDYPYSLLVLVLDAKKRRVFACESDTITPLMKLRIHSRTLVRGAYSITVLINMPSIGHIDIAEDVCQFTVLDTGSKMAKHGGWDYGIVFGRYDWE
jgi:lipopolysaccharide transport system ATP-binding protein